MTGAMFKNANSLWKKKIQKMGKINKNLIMKISILIILIIVKIIIAKVF